MKIIRNIGNFIGPLLVKKEYLLLPGSPWGEGYLQSKTFTELAKSTFFNTDEIELLLEGDIEYIFVVSFDDVSYAKIKKQDKTIVYTITVQQLPPVDNISSIPLILEAKQ